MNNRSCYHFIILACCLLSNGALAASTSPWTFFTSQNGLPEDRTRQVLQDRNGRLLVLTFNEGLFYYDGRQFNPHPVNEKLPSLFIQSVVLDKKGRLWIACNYHGLWIYENGAVKPFRDNALLENQHFAATYCDSHNRIWVYVNRVGLFRIQDSTAEHLTSRLHLPLEDITAMQEHQGLFYFLATSGAMYTLDMTSGRYQPYPIHSLDQILHFLIARDGAILALDRKEGLAELYPDETLLLKVDLRVVTRSQLLEDHQGRIWFSSPEKLYCYDRQSHTFTEENFIGESIPFEDHFYHLWFATTNGLATTPNPTHSTFAVPHRPTNSAASLDQLGNSFYYVDRQGRHWFLNQNNRLVRFDGKKAELFPWPDSLKSFRVTAMVQDASGRYWFAGDRRRLYRWDGHTLDHPIPFDRLPAAYISSLLFDGDNRLWIGGHSAFVSYASTKTNNLIDTEFQEKWPYSHPQDYSCLYVHGQEVWLADCSRSIYHGEQNRFRLVATFPEADQNLEIFHHLVGNERGLWGTTFHRIFCIESKNRGADFTTSYHPISFSPLLPDLEQFAWPVGSYRSSRLVHSIPQYQHFKQEANKQLYHLSAMLADSSALWLASYSVGLVRSDADTIIRFGPEHGLPSLRISALFRDRRNRLWIGTLDHGLFEYRQGRFHQTNAIRRIGTSIHALTSDSDGKIWIATLDNGLAALADDGVHCYSEGLPHPAIWGAGIAADGSVYAALNDNCFAKLENGRFTVLPGNAILIDQNLRAAFAEKRIEYRRYLLHYSDFFSNSLVSWKEGALSRHTVHDGLPGHDVTDMAIGADGHLYVATFNTGISRYKNGRFETLTDSSICRLNAITRLEPCADSSLWVLTQDEGLARIKAETAQRWLDNSNLLSFRISDLFSYGNNLLCTDARHFYYFAFNRLHSFYVPAEEVNGFRIAPCFHLDSTRTLWYVSRDNQLNRLGLSSVPPLISLTNCRIENDDYGDSAADSTIQRGYKDRAIVLEFFGYHPDFAQKGITYSYRIIRNEAAEPWQFTALPQLIFTRLEPGTTHRFEIKSHAPNGTASSPLRIVVHTAGRPLYLQTWFFWLWITLALLALAGYFIYRYYHIQDLLFRRRFNPYIAGEPVVKSEMFYGRDEILRRILGVLHNNNIMIIGERRIGKTSLLQQLKLELTRPEPNYTFVPVYIDLQGVEQWEFFRSMMHDIVEQALPPAAALALRVNDKPEAYEYRDFTQDLRQVINYLAASSTNTLKLTLLIDEADAMNRYDQIVHSRLRRIFMHDLSLNLSAVITGTRFIQDWNRPESPWWNLFTLMELGALGRRHAEELIRTPVKGLFHFTDDAVAAVIKISECKPYLIQLMCLQLLDRALDSKNRTIRVQDVDAMVAHYPLFQHLV